MKTALLYDFVLAVLLPASLSVGFLWNLVLPQGSIFFGDALPFLKYEWKIFERHNLSTWTGGPNTGYTSIGSGIILLGLGSLLGAEVATKIFALSLSFLPATSMYFSSRSLLLSGGALQEQQKSLRHFLPVGISLIYMLNSYNLGFTVPLSQFSWSYILLPLLASLFVRLIDGLKITHLCLFLLLSTFSSLSPTLILLLTLFAFLWTSFRLIVNPSFVGARRILSRAGVVALSAVVVNLFWILPTIMGYVGGASGFFQYYTARQLITYESLLGYSFWDLLGVLFLGHPDFYLFGLWARNWTIFSLLIPALATSAALIQKADQKTTFFLLLLTMGSFLAKGARAPLGMIYVLLASNLPLGLGAILRNVGIFTYIVAFATSILIGISALKLGRLAATHAYVARKKILRLLLPTLVLLLPLLPSVGGLLLDMQVYVPRYEPVQIPAVYYEAYDWLGSHGTDGKAIWLPTGYPVTWKDDSITAFPSSLSPIESLPSTLIEGSLYSPYLARFLALLNVKYLIVHTDAIGYPVLQVLDSLRNQPYLSLVWHRDFLYVFENSLSFGQFSYGPAVFVVGDLPLVDAWILDDFLNENRLSNIISGPPVYSTDINDLQTRLGIIEVANSALISRTSLTDLSMSYVPVQYILGPQSQICQSDSVFGFTSVEGGANILLARVRLAGEPILKFSWSREFAEGDQATVLNSGWSVLGNITLAAGSHRISISNLVGDGCIEKVAVVPTSVLQEADAKSTLLISSFDQKAIYLSEAYRVSTPTPIKVQEDMRNIQPRNYGGGYLSIEANLTLDRGQPNSVFARYTIPPEVLEQGFSGKFTAGFSILLFAVPSGAKILPLDETHSDSLVTSAKQQIMTNDTSGTVAFDLNVPTDYSHRYVDIYAYFYDGGFRRLTPNYYLGNYPVRGIAFSQNSDSTTSLYVFDDTVQLDFLAPRAGDHDLLLQSNGNFTFGIQGSTTVTIVKENGWTRIPLTSLTDGRLRITLHSDYETALGLVALIPHSDHVVADIFPAAATQRYTMLGSSRWKVELSGATPGLLTLSEPYDSLWRVHSSIEDRQPMRIFGLTNGFLLRQSFGTVEVRYTLQMFLEAGATISLVAMLGLVSLVIITFTSSCLRNQVHKLASGSKCIALYSFGELYTDKVVPSGWPLCRLVFHRNCDHRPPE